MISFDKRRLRSFDFFSFGLIALLSIVGILFVLSTTYQPSHPCSLFLKKQIFGMISGYLIFITLTCTDYRRIQRWGYICYLITLALLFFTLFKGSVGLGAQRWINLGLFKFQPSELVKLFFPAFFTSLVETHDEMTLSKSFLLALMWLLISLLLIMKQPDLGTAIIIAISSLLMWYYSGVSTLFFMALFALISIASPLLWKNLKPYQKQRVYVFLGYGDSKRERYQIEQSRIAIGSGGITGKGFLCGTQNMMQFLPESRTDFIFSILCEEWGFMGALTVILLYGIFFLRLLLIIPTLHTQNAQMLAIGLVAPIIIATIVNMGMVTELLPSVGIPLPFMTYGITHLWITFASLGWFMSILLHQ